MKSPIFLVIACCAASLAHACANSSEHELLRKISADLFESLTSVGEPDAHGLVKNDPSALTLAARVFSHNDSK